MALSLTRLSWWWWVEGREKEQVSNGSSTMNSLSDWGGFGLKEPDNNLKFTSVKKAAEMASSRPKIRRKWKSREERRRVDKEYDVVLVPSDGVYLSSGSESDDSDWSIGWLEPHAPGFQSDDEADDSFSVLVPCYRHHDCLDMKKEPNNQFLTDIKNLPNQYSNGESKKYMEQWLSSLQNF